MSRQTVPYPRPARKAKLFLAIARAVLCFFEKMARVLHGLCIETSCRDKAAMTDPVANTKTFFKGQIIYKEGQPGAMAYMIKKGSVNLFRMAENRKVILLRLAEGEIFGETGIIGRGPRTTSAEAADYCELLALTEQTVGAMLEKCPKTIQHLTTLLIRRLEKADDLSPIPAKEQKSPFLVVCKVLDLLYQLHEAGLSAAAKRSRQPDRGVSLVDLSRTVKEIVPISQGEIESTLEQLRKIKLVEISSRAGSKAFPEQFVRVVDPGSFYAVAQSLHKEIRKAGGELELEYIDIFDLAAALGADPQTLYRKLANEEIPPSLFFFSRARTLSWAERQDRDFFKKVRRKKKTPDELEDVNDIVFVDSGTLKEVFAKLGYYKLGVLVAVAGAEARRRILESLARKIAAIVEEEAARRRSVSDAEAQDIQDELIDLIRQAKGVRT